MELDALICSGNVSYAGISSYESVYYLTSRNGGVYKLGKTYEGVAEGKNSVFVFPNPVSETVHIDGVEAVEVQVCNALGKMVKRVMNYNEVSLGGLPQGVYMLKIRDAEGKVYINKITIR